MPRLGLLEAECRELGVRYGSRSPGASGPWALVLGGKATEERREGEKEEDDIKSEKLQPQGQTRCRGQGYRKRNVERGREGWR